MRQAPECAIEQANGLCRDSSTCASSMLKVHAPKLLMHAGAQHYFLKSPYSSHGTCMQAGRTSALNGVDQLVVEGADGDVGSLRDVEDVGSQAPLSPAGLAHSAFCERPQAS